MSVNSWSAFARRGSVSRKSLNMWKHIWAFTWRVRLVELVGQLIELEPYGLHRAREQLALIQELVCSGNFQEATMRSRIAGKAMHAAVRQLVSEQQSGMEWFL